MKNKPIKLLALDMDGTTFRLHGNIIKSNIKPILEAKKMGVHVIFVTGRPLYNVLIEIKKHNLQDLSEYIVTFNGACIYHVKTKKIVFRDHISPALIEEIFKVGNKYNIDVWCYTSSDKKIITNFDPTNFEEKNFLGNDVVIENRPKDGNFFIDGYKLLVIENRNIQGHTLINKICEKNKLQLSYGVTSAYEINSASINKGIALKKLGKMLNINMDEVMAIGDGDNDIPMFKVVGLPIAVNNATDDVKKYAKYITDTNLNGGVAKAITKYILNNKEK